MTKKTQGEAPRLRLIRGGLGRGIYLRGVRVVAAPKYRSPFPVEAMTHEEDTFLVLSRPVNLVPEQHPIRVLTAAHSSLPETPGGVVVKAGNPLRFLAVIHDLKEEPSWREAWIAKALDAAFAEAEKRGLGSLGLQLLGMIHGNLREERFVALLRAAIERASFKTVKRLWLITPDGAGDRFLDRLEACEPP